MHKRQKAHQQTSRQLQVRVAEHALPLHPPCHVLQFQSILSAQRARGGRSAISHSRSNSTDPRSNCKIRFHFNGIETLETLSFITTNNLNFQL